MRRHWWTTAELTATRKKHHVRQVDEAYPLVESPALLGGLEVDLLGTPLPRTRDQPSHDGVPDTAVLRLRTRVDVHEVGTLARQVVWRGHLALEAHASAADDLPIDFGKAGDVPLPRQLAGIVRPVLPVKRVQVVSLG